MRAQPDSQSCIGSQATGIREEPKVWMHGASKVSGMTSVHMTAPAVFVRNNPAPASTALRIREAREKLNSRPTSRPEFQYELLAIFVKSELTASLAIPILAIVVAVGLSSWAPFEGLLFWLAALFVAKGILIKLCRDFQAVNRKQADTVTWQRKLAAAEFLYGITWASVVFTDIGSAHQISGFFFAFATVMVVIAIRTMFASTVLSILYAGTIPMTAAIVIRCLLLGHPFYWAMATVAVGIHVYLIFLATGHNKTVLTMLEQSKATSDEARRHAEAANVSKSKFLANMSHELRTPLNAILGFSEIMSTEVLGPLENPTYKGYSEDINRSGQHLLNLINQILDLSRIEAGRYELEEEPVSLAFIMEDCRRLLKLRADSKGLNVVENYEPNMRLLWAEQRAVRQICLNLLSNAIKFTPSGGSIILTIGTNARGEQFLSVKDTGPGIPENEIPRVMSFFGQGSLAQRTAEGGSGLGLPIVKGLVDLHGGSFELKSKLRQGTEIMIAFPQNRIMPMPALAANSYGFLAAPQQQALALGAA
jgi:two-component system cell cycle sensor histidine kinase PleC